MDSSSWSFSSEGFSNAAKIDPFSAVYAVMKKEDETGRCRNALQSHMYCRMIFIGKTKLMREKAFLITISCSLKQETLT